MKTRLSALLLSLCLLGSMLPATAAAAQSSAPVKTENLGAQNYRNLDYWSAVVNSYLVDNGNGSVTRVEYTGSDVTVETYDEQFQLIYQQTIPMELTKFGGFYEGTDSYFLVFGQNNASEDNSQEVIRVVRYDKNWNRIASGSLYGSNITVPFSGGTLRMTEAGGRLYIHTSRKMYAIDGVNHQSNMSLTVNIATMEVTDVGTALSANGYVSHSFNQFILADPDGNLVTADHGDGYPRGFVLDRFDDAAGSDTVFERTDWENVPDRVIYHRFAGSIGDNETNAALGGLEYSETSYLTAGYAMSEEYAEEEIFLGEAYTSEEREALRAAAMQTYQNKILQGYTLTFYIMSDSTNRFYYYVHLEPPVVDAKNIFVSATSRTDFTEDGTAVYWITNYSGEDDVTVSVPQLVKISDTQFLLLWTENETTLRYVFLDENGETTSRIYQQERIYLSDCQPIVSGNRVIWYVTGRTEPLFYSIDLSSPEQVTIENTLAYGGLYYTIENGKVTIENQNGSVLLDEELVIPASIEGYPVTQIADDAFLKCNLLRSIVVPDTVTEIGSFAFAHCTSLTDITISDSVTDLGMCAFAGCTSLERVTLSQNLTRLNTETFNGCTSLKKLTIPASVSFIELYAFLNCDNLKDIYYGGLDGTWIWINTLVDLGLSDDVSVHYTSATTPEPETSRFADVSASAWYASYVEQAYQLGIMIGTSDTTFEPTNPTTRAAFVQSLYGMAGKPEVTGITPFVDLTANWYQNAVLWAYQNQVTKGTSDTTFAPNANVTREQIAIFLYSYAGSPQVSGDLSQFPDGEAVDSWAKTAMIWAVDNGILSGTIVDGTIYLNPLATATRAETATMLVRFQQSMNP